MRTSVTDEAGVLHLTGALDINEAESVRQALLAYGARQPGWRLELGGVTACDAAGAQLLWAAQRSAAAAGGRLEITAVPLAVRSCWEQLGLEPEFFTTPTTGGGHEQDDSDSR